MDADAVIARAVEVFGSEKKSRGWLNDPNLVLADATPRSLLSTPEGVQRVLTVLGRIEYGVFS